VITLKVLKWGNMFSYGDNNSLDLNSADKIVQVNGINGVGKSSINLVLEELLYNKNSRKIAKADILNRDNGASSYWANLTFSVDTDEYYLELTRERSAKLLLTKNGEDISGHTASQTYKLVEGLLGDDFSTFTQKVYQGMSSSLQFLTATDAARKKFLVALLDLEQYGEYNEAIKDYAKEGAGEVSGLQKSLDSSKAWLDSAKSEQGLKVEELPELIEYTSIEEADQITDLKAKLLSIDSHNKEYTKHKKLRAEQLEIENKLAELVPPQPWEVKLTSDDRLEKAQALIDTFRAEYTAAASILKKIKGLEGQCPTCLSDIEEERIEALVEENRFIMGVAKAGKLVPESELKGAVTLQQEFNSLTALDTKYTSDLVRYKKDLAKNLESQEGLPTVPLLEGELRTELARLETKALRYKEKAESAADAYTKVLEQNTKILAAKEIWGKYSIKIEEDTAALATAVEEMEQVETLKKAFSPNGIVALRINQAVALLESDINSYLADFCDGRFSLHFVLEGSKLNVKIQDKGKLVSIQSISSGQLARVTIATVLAIRKLMSKNSANSINLLFLDEITATLDREGKEQLVEILFKEKDLNVFLVIQGWEHPLIPSIEVVGSAKGSYIERDK